MHTEKKYCILIAGPTAVGKTALAIDIARHFSTEIISADSRQCFKELNIGVAKPSAEELSQVPHHFINSHSIQEEVNAAVFEEYALEKVQQVFQTKNVVVITGGTGLYLKAFCEGMDEVPAIDIAVRNGIIEAYQQNGLQWLRQQVQQHDPAYFATGEIQNPQRMMRALEVVCSTGRSVLSFQTNTQKHRPFTIIKMALELPRELLYNRINNRVDAMMTMGLLQEAKQLVSYRHLNALQTVGYRELFEYLDGNGTGEQAAERIKLNTRHYAKRQMTWFKKDAGISWCPPDADFVLKVIKAQMI
ncbi:MAG TPA: tRNA (adenosine(37)-N6)-dimethylallyltransferase MiaA [Ferruginibacter sp.]|nr:tRNA (adenosine(37)-N6)-dimethylallyltransferase MiaA [Ferruginibacter sp.]HMP22046.1 tRNA (adenosine(37)-N6)-dimethylallyltransferase MiaA [Ferruginibacter sp.]